MKRAISIITLLAVLLSVLVVSPATPARASTMQTYIVLYKAQAVPANAASVIASAGGTLIYRYNQIGVAIARSRQ